MSTSSDVASLARELWRWEHAEYVFAGCVAAACAGEYVADFNKRPWVEKRKESIAKSSTWALIIALVLELICVVKTNQLSGRVIGDLRDRAEGADTLAQKAIQDSGAAIKESGQAITNAGAANSTAFAVKGEADTAKSLASDAKARALESGTRVRAVERQAESLSRDIAAERESFRRLRTWRSFTNKESMISSLQPFAGVEYQFSAVYGDEESEYLLAEINGVLTKARWTMVKPVLAGNENTVELNLNKVPEHIPVTTLVGIRVFIQYPTSFEELRGLPEGARLQHARAAGVLLKLLSTNLFPPDDDEQRKNIFFEKTGESRTVKIIVGRKP